MRKLTIIALLGSLSIAGPVGASHGPQGYQDIATVVHVEPIVRHVRVATPRRECWDEEVRQPARHGGHGAGPMIIGGVIGGVIGHQFGRRVHKGRGSGAATVAGTLIGAAIGHEHAAGHHRDYDQATRETRCTTYTDYHDEERVDAYRVTYQYRGQTLQTRLPYDPGDSLRVRVQVTPMVD